MEVVKEFSVPMALVDFISALLFLIGAVVLQRSLYMRMSKGAFALFAAGTIDIICAGSLKALYKLLYAAGICDFQALDRMFFPVQSIGFLLAGLGVLAMLTHRQGAAGSENARGMNGAVLGAGAMVAPPVYKGTFLFVGLMVAGAALMNIGLAVLCKKNKKGLGAALFIACFLLELCMGYLSSRNFAEAKWNWIAEFVNIAAQGAFLGGALAVKKAE